MRHSRLSWRQQRGVDLIAVSRAMARGTSITGDRAPLVAVAHGSRDPRAAATVSELLSVVRSRAALRPGLDGLDVRAAFLDHCAPSLPQVLGSIDADGTIDGTVDGSVDSTVDSTAVVVPLLLTAAYHSKSDIPAQLAAARDATAGALDVRCADTLGPHPLLVAALERRLREAGVPVDSAADRAATSVVLAAAGSSDPAANATITDLAAAWRRDRGWRDVVPAYASAAAPSPAEAVRALLREGSAQGSAAQGSAAQGSAAQGSAAQGSAGPVVVATYLLAPGYFADKIRASAVAAGASAVSAALGAAPEVADVILGRYAAAIRHNRLWQEPSYAERTVATPQLVTCSIRGRPTWNGSYGACAAPRIT
jgi:sirohydrochlorin ferrochelatase